MGTIIPVIAGQVTPHLQAALARRRMAGIEA
jgi:hypothetical protein